MKKELEQKKLDFTVDLETWDCFGNRHNPNHHKVNSNGVIAGVLLKSESGMCCLGFACSSLGYRILM